jgi:hypothetical protein
LTVGYYILNPIFKPWPMKTLSNMLGQMWEADPNKSLWSLMTKAWSNIRDQIGKGNAPLDQFFRIICPHLNIPSPETYLECQGWKLVISQEGTPTLSRDADTLEASLAPGFAHMALSVEDIIVYCQAMGYAQGYVADMDTTSSTFLGRSLNQVTEKDTITKAKTQTAGPSQAHRVAARNKRRMKRQNARETGVVPALQAQIVNAHNTDISNVPLHGSTSNYNFEPFQFYDNMAQFLTGPIADLGNGSGNVQGNESAALTTTDAGIPLWTADYNAFRFGADEDATMPFFNSASL